MFKFSMYDTKRLEVGGILTEFGAYTEKDDNLKQMNFLLDKTSSNF